MLGLNTRRSKKKTNDIFEFNYEKIYLVDDFDFLTFVRSVSDGSDVVVDFFDNLRV